MSDLTSLRSKIDHLDAKLVEMLNERARVSIQIGSAKRSAPSTGQEPSAPSNDQPVDKTHFYVPTREKAVFEKIARLNHGPLTTDALVAIYREVMSASISLQKEITIAYLGPPGTYSHQCAMSRFGDSVQYYDESTIADVFSAVDSGRATYGIVPFENSWFGSVVQTLDGFISTKSKIRAEAYLRVQHCLLSNSTKGNIRKVYSHPEALGQCARWLQVNLPGVETVSVSSTATAAKIASSEPNAAAICSSVCAEIYNLSIVQTDIQDDKDNTTRFFIIGDSSDSVPTPQDRSLIMFTVDHRKPGALCDALSVFKSEGINLTKIDSRPARSRPWHYYFFVEFEGHAVAGKQENLQRVMKKLTEEFCLEFRLLGSYTDMKNIVGGKSIPPPLSSLESPALSPLPAPSSVPAITPIAQGKKESETN